MDALDSFQNSNPIYPKLFMLHTVNLLFKSILITFSNPSKVTPRELLAAS